MLVWGIAGYANAIYQIQDWFLINPISRTKPGLADFGQANPKTAQGKEKPTFCRGGIESALP